MSVWGGAENGDYSDPNSQFSTHRMAETENLAAFWEAGFGDDPENCMDEKFRFPLKEIMELGEQMYVFFRDELRFAIQGDSVSDKYRINLYFFYNEDGTVYGGGCENTIGAMWLSPNRVKRGPHGALAHEMGHSWHYITWVDRMSKQPPDAAENKRRGGPGMAFGEMSCQYMLWQFYPEWLTFENYHLVAFRKEAHLAFLHTNNAYRAAHVLEYWASSRGKGIIGDIWRLREDHEDPVMTYKRLNNIGQDAFIAEMFDGARRFITWDIDRIRDASAAHANLQECALTAAQDGWYTITPNYCPGNYGYNGIRLEVPAAGTNVELTFKGIAGDAAFKQIQVEKAGWRYGFLAMTTDGERIYSDMYADANGKAVFTIPEKTAFLWLVVMGAPTEHWAFERSENNEKDEQWPYQIKLSGTGFHEMVSIV